MHWDYRVTRDEHGTFRIRELYHNSDGTLFGWSDPVAPQGDSLSELLTNLRWMTEALDKPVIDEADLPPCICTQRDRAEASCPWHGTRVTPSTVTVG